MTTSSTEAENLETALRTAGHSRADLQLPSVEEPLPEGALDTLRSEELDWEFRNPSSLSKLTPDAEG